MKRGQFLLQREKDNYWTNINSQESYCKIAEGNYRVAAYYPQLTNIPVEISISYFNQERNNHLVNSWQKFSYTDSEGVIEILPFTYLKPGSWKFSCCSDCQSQFLGNPVWDRYKLQVIPGNQLEKSQLTYSSLKTKAKATPNSNNLAQQYLAELETILQAKMTLDEENSQNSAPTILDDALPASLTEKFSDLDAAKVNKSYLDLFNPHKNKNKINTLKSATGQILPPKLTQSFPVYSNIQLPKFSKLNTSAQISPASSTKLRKTG